MNFIVPENTPDNLKELHERIIKHFYPKGNVIASDDVSVKGVHFREGCFLIKKINKKLLKQNISTDGFYINIENEMVSNKRGSKNWVYNETVEGFLYDNSFVMFKEINDDVIFYLNDFASELEDDSEYLPQDPISSVLRYGKERAKWAKAGKPVRSKERVKELYDICSTCPYYEPSGTFGRAFCSICGCGISTNEKDTNLNKLTWATTKCPLKKPKWTEDA